MTVMKYSIQKKNSRTTSKKITVINQLFLSLIGKYKLLIITTIGEEMDGDKKAILDITTKGWEKNIIDNLAKSINSRYKYQITFETSDGRTKWAYSNDPVMTEMYLRTIGAIILKTEIQNEST